MNKTLQFLLLSLYIASVWSETSETPSLDSSNSGTLNIFKNEYGFHVLSDFQYDWSHADDKPGGSSYPMMLGLYTGQTVFTADCLNFKHYDCVTWKCVNRSEPVATISYPFFEAKGDYVQAVGYLEYRYWYLDSNSLIASKCTSGASPSYGQSTYGVLGMGVAEQARRNFHSNQIFSVWLQKDKKAGKLMFREDYSYAASKTRVTTLVTDDNWQAKIKTFWVGTYSITVPDSTKFIFELNTDAIGLPETLFQQMMDMMRLQHSITCVDSKTEVKCKYNGYMYNLPTLHLISDYFSLPISPEIYVQDYQAKNYVNQIIINIKSLSPEATGRSYVSKEYQNHIILDANVMRYYYTVFDATNKVPAIYIYEAAELSSSSPSYAWVYIVVGILAVVIIGLVVYFKYIKKAKAGDSYAPNISEYHQQDDSLHPQQPGENRE